MGESARTHWDSDGGDRQQLVHPLAISLQAMGLCVPVAGTVSYEKVLYPRPVTSPLEPTKVWWEMRRKGDED